MTVVVRDLFEALIGDSAATRHVAQEGDDIVLALGAAESGKQDRVVRDRRLDVGRARLGGGRAERHCALAWRNSALAFRNSFGNG